VGPRDCTGEKAFLIDMKALRALLTGWPAVFSFLFAPTLAVLLAPHDHGEWKRWLVVAPFVLAYIWFTWPGGRTGDD
jgi:hypothetical protein